MSRIRILNLRLWHLIFLTRREATVLGNSLIFTASFKQEASNLFWRRTTTGSWASRVKLTIRGTPNLFNYCVISIVYIIRKCNRWSRVGHGWFRGKSGGNGQFWKSRFRRCMEKSRFTAATAAWRAGNSAIVTLFSLQAHMCEDAVLDRILSCVSIVPAQRSRPRWVWNSAEL